jgi:hypothetical protein
MVVSADDLVCTVTHKLQVMVARYLHATPICLRKTYIVK